jgi:hypothetical protein
VSGSKDEMRDKDANLAEADPAQGALALPREIEPPPGLWAGIEARVAAKQRQRVALRRTFTGASMLLAAAAVLLAVRFGPVRLGKGPHPDDAPTRAPIASTSLPIEAAHQGSPIAPAAPDSTGDPTAALVVPEEASYRAALATLAPAFDARKTSLPEKDLAKVSASLHALDAAIGVTRASLLEHPDDADLRAELDAEYEQKIDAMNDVLEWTTRS